MYQCTNVSISRYDYYKARLFGLDNRFASNTNYIFFAQYVYEAETLLNSVSINLRKGSDAGKIKKSMITDQAYLKKFIKNRSGV